MATSPHKIRAVPQPPKSAGRRERHRAETRERLYQAALALFAERGFMRTTVEDITEKADVGKGTFFNYFPTKEHILAEFGGAYLVALENALEEARAGKTPVLEVIKELVITKIRHINENDALIRAIYSAHASCESVRAQLQDRVALCRRVLAEIVKIGQERGELRRDIPAVELGRSSQMTFMGVTMGWAIYPSATLRKVLEETWEILEPGLRAPDRSSADGRRRKSK
jgi:AcrR family transcriptional regulator